MQVLSLPSKDIGKIGKYLDESSIEILIHAFVTSKLEYCNALLNGLPKYQTNRLQFLKYLTLQLVYSYT